MCDVLRVYVTRNKTKMGTALSPIKNKQHETGKISKNKRRIGKDFQAKIPDFIPHKARDNNLEEKALITWRPTDELCEKQIDAYVRFAKNKGFKEDRALGVLHWHKLDVGKATTDIVNFTPTHKMWSSSKKSRFDQMIRAHGKDFQLIQRAFKGNTIQDLISYYYNYWKKEEKSRKMVVVAAQSQRRTVIL